MMLLKISSAMLVKTNAIFGLLILFSSSTRQQNPVTKRMQPWLDLKSLDFIYGDSVGFLPCHPTSVWKFLKILRP